MGILFTIFNIFQILLLIYIILPWFGMNPYHPVRQTLARIFEPLLAPIRQVLPAMGGLDFSPLVLILLLSLLQRLLIAVI